MKNELLAFLREEDGVTAIEYGLIAGLVAIVVIGALSGTDGLGAKLKALFEKITTELTNATT